MIALVVIQRRDTLETAAKNFLRVLGGGELPVVVESFGIIR
jgi:hypothetical protein